MNSVIVVSIDGGVSGNRAACAAVIRTEGRVLFEDSRTVPDAQRYVLTAELAGAALAAELIDRIHTEDRPVIIETDNPSLLRLLRGDYRPPGFHRIPRQLLERAEALCWLPYVEFRVLRRNSTPGLRRAHRLSRARLWAKRRRRER